jgi:ubiquinone/menaquinone biosynthesis C-methylase UbiE
MSDRTRKAYDQWASTYDISPNPQIVLEFPDVLGLLAPIAGETILDAACGTGRYTMAIAEHGAVAIGLDFSTEMLAIARRRMPATEFYAADLMKPLPFVSHRFDAILTAQALKHVPDLGIVISEFARVLRPGGRLVFSVTHPGMFWTDYEMREHPGFLLNEHADITHHHFEDYTGAIEDSGLRITQIVEIPISERIRALLTERSYPLVVGRKQILAIRAERPNVGYVVIRN